MDTRFCRFILNSALQITYIISFNFYSHELIVHSPFILSICCTVPSIFVLSVRFFVLRVRMKLIITIIMLHIQMMHINGTRTNSLISLSQLSRCHCPKCIDQVCLGLCISQSIVTSRDSQRNLCFNDVYKGIYCANRRPSSITWPHSFDNCCSFCFYKFLFYAHVCINVYVYVYVYACIYIYIYIYIYTYISVCVCVYVCVHVCMHACVYAYMF